MSCYVNPPQESKEAFLNREGRKIHGKEIPRRVKDIPADLLLVCLVDNGWMTAAAVGYSDRELEEFTRSDDPRPRTYYMVPLDKLREVCPEIDDCVKN